MRLIPLLALFFLSGAAALVYEVVWIRLLSLTLSVTVYALTTVLCSFMAGLALGAALAARLADRLERPLVAFGLAEIGIALCGLSVPAVLYGLGPAYVWMSDALGGQGASFHVGRFLLSFGVLLVPTTLMGTTLPFLSRVAIGSADMAGRGAGALYAANTLGAVAGCVAAGFSLVPQLGLGATSRVAAACNVAIGTLAIALGTRRVAPLQASGGARPPLSRPARLAALAFGISGFTALGYEVLWTRALEHYTHNSTYAYSAMLAMFLGGIGLGSAVAARRADRLARPLLALGAVQIAVGGTVVLALLVYLQFETWVPGVARWLGGLTSWPRVLALIFGEAAVTLMATTLLFGAVFPLVARIMVDELRAVGNRIGTAYVANTLGSILGALLVGFVLLPELGVRGAFLALLCTNLALGALLLHAGLPGMQGRLAAAGAAAVALLGFAVIPPDFLESRFRERFGILRFYREEVTDTIMVTESPDGQRLIRYGDGRGTAGTSTVIEDRMYAHIPMLLHRGPKRVLQIGFGVGNTLSSVARYPIEKAVCAELSQGVADAAPFFASTNRDVLEDPRVSLVTNDGRNFLLGSDEPWDVIRLDPPELHTAGVVNLYTREFLVLAREHLAPGGIFSIWVNNVMTPESGLRMIAATMLDVFPHVSVWHGPAAYSWIYNGSIEPHDPDLARLRDAFADPAIGADLRSIGIEDPFQFLFHFVRADESLAEYAAGAPVVTDDHTRLDFESPRSPDSFYGIANINTDNWLADLIDPDRRGGSADVATAAFMRKVAALAKHKQPVLPHVVGIERAGYDRAEVRERLEHRRRRAQR